LFGLPRAVAPARRMADGRESPDSEARPTKERETGESWMPGFMSSGADWCKAQLPALAAPQETRSMNIVSLKGAMAIEQAARVMEDFELPKRPKGQKASNSAWLREGLGITEDTGASDQAATNAVVRGAAGRGKIKILSSLYDEGQWDPWRCRLSIEAADEGGYLLDLLKSFLVHLSWYPSLAEEQEALAMEELASSPNPGEKKALAKSPLQRELTQKTCLLSNLLLVNSPMAARVLDNAAEEMVVFRGATFPPVRRHPHKKFPATLDTLYVKRYIKERDASKMAYDRSKRTLYLPGAMDPTPTSVEAVVSLDKEARQDLLIPLTAENFCFVYPCEELPWGGFLYLDTDRDEVKPLVINKLSHDAGQQAFAFGDPIPLSEEHTQRIFDELQDLAPDCPYLEQGATQFAWLMSFPGGEVEVPFGGFAYVFQDSKQNRLFPLKAVGEVLRMANLSWEVNAHALSMQSNGDDIQKYIAPRGEDRAAPVQIMRITASDVLHPMMLHGLAYTPREDVLATDVAKAISYAAYNRAFPFYVQQLAFDFLSAMILFYIAWEVHRIQERDGRVMWEFTPWNKGLAYSVILLVLLKNCFEELRKFIGFWKCKWMKEYMNTNTLKDLGSMAVVALALVLLVHPDPPEDSGLLRSALAAAGFLKWIKVVTYFRGMLWLRLGPKFLPVSYTLLEGLSFLVVMMFFILAAWHAFYTLYPTKVSWTYLLSMTYNLGFFGDFDLDTMLSPETTEGETSYAWVQQLFFGLAAMLVMVMLTNIYIGVMANAYDHYHGKALELFVRARASICLDISMQYGNAWQVVFGDREGPKLEDEYVWFCKADSDYDLSSAADDTNESVNHMVRELRQSMEKQVKDLSKQVQHVQDLSVQSMGLTAHGVKTTPRRESVPPAFHRPMTSPGHSPFDAPAVPPPVIRTSGLL